MSAANFLLTLVLTFVISTVTLLTGFGVGAVLTPTFMLFHDIKTAVFLVAVVHLANNLLKLGLFRQYVNRNIFFRFGLVSIAGALVGSYLLGSMNSALIRLALGIYLVVTGASEFLPAASSLKIPKKFDLIAGFFSGLMGGLIGNQGAVRSAYLLNYGLSKEAFIATGVAIAILNDLTRIPLYIHDRIGFSVETALTLLVTVGVAWLGTLTGTRLLKSISLERFRSIVSFVLAAFGVVFIVQSIL